MNRPTLVVIRGNSGSGKTTVARRVRERYGRGCALLEQDHLRRHATRDAGFTTEDMRSWYAARDLLGSPGEVVIPEDSSLAETVDTILHGSGLAGAAATTPCPAVCPRCAEKGGR